MGITLQVLGFLLKLLCFVLSYSLFLFWVNLEIRVFVCFFVFPLFSLSLVCLIRCYWCIETVASVV